MVQADRSLTYLGNDHIIIFIAQLIGCCSSGGQWAVAQHSNKYQ